MKFSFPTHRRRGVAALSAALLATLPHQGGGQASTQRFQRVNTTQGLSQESGLSLAQDSLGFVWIGTYSGLNRYDGNGFVVFRHKPEDKSALHEGWVNQLTVDPSGYVWAGTYRGLSRFDPRTETFRTYMHDGADTSSLSNDRVEALIATADGQIWIGTASGLERLDPSTGHITRFRHDPRDPSSLGAGPVNALYADRSGRLWIATSASLNRWDAAAGAFVHFGVDSARARSAGDQRISAILESAPGKLWVGSRYGGLYLLDERTSSVRRFAHSRTDPNSLLDDDVLSLGEDARNNLWIGTPRGLDRLDTVTGRFVHHPVKPDDPFALPNSSVLSLLRDRTGVMWIGTNAGVTRLAPLNLAFTTYVGNPDKPSQLPAGAPWGLGEGADHRILIGAEGGLAWLDPRTDVVTHMPFRGAGEPAPWNFITAIENVPGDRLWVASRGGLGYIDPKRGAYVDFHWTTPPPNGARRISTFAQDTSGSLWVAPYGFGVVRVSPNRATWRSYVLDSLDKRSLSSNVVYVLHTDATGTTWAGTTDGLNRYDPKTDSFVRYTSVPDDTTTLSDGVIASLYRADAHTLWVGTARGLNRLNPVTGLVVRYNLDPSLPRDFINGILPGEGGILWLVSNHGIYRFDPRSGAAHAYQTQDGVLGNETQVNVSLRASDGRYYIPGTYGITAFSQRDLDAAAHSPAVVLTALRVSNEPVPVGSALLPRSLQFADDLTLTHQQRSFALEFSALEYGSAERSRFAYRLDGFDRDWVQTSTDNRRATYTNLSPGTYTFRVRAIDAGGARGEKEASLVVHIRPHPLASRWAYATYVLILVAGVLGWERNHRRRLTRERAVNTRLREVDRLKDEFLANISHELRTPLHGVIGMAESLRDGAAGALPAKARSDLGIVVTGARRLASLVNDILDFSKMRNAALRLDLGPVDLRCLTDGVTDLMRPLANEKGLVLRNDVAMDFSSVQADEGRVQQILYNLVGNAIKFTETGSVVISGSVEGDMVALRVTDTGRGISPDEITAVFEPFHQVEGSAQRQQAGTGLGLALARHLAELHGGRLSVESTLGVGSTFVLMLPRSETRAGHNSTVTPSEPIDLAQGRLRESRGLHLAPAAGEDESISEVSDEGRGVRVLVVDDDATNRQVMLNSLVMHGYEVVTVNGGEEALVAIESGPPIDIVLLDVMMPKMSGYQTCERLRQAHPAHELPVLFLTARNQLSDIVDGFEAGGNDYLTKPVAKAELLSRLRTQSRLLSASRNLEYLVTERTAQVKTLSGLLPICSHCHAIRDAEGYWERLEAYMRHHSDATFSHGICPPCVEKHFGDLMKDTVPETAP